MGQSLPSDSAPVPTNVCFAPIATVRRATHSEPRPHCGFAFLDQRHRVAYWTNNGQRAARGPNNSAPNDPEITDPGG